MSYRKQVEIASSGQNDIDFYLNDNSDGNGIQIIPIKGGFVIPTDAQINAARGRADADVAELVSAKRKVRGRPTGGNSARLNERLTDIEALLAAIIKDA